MTDLLYGGALIFGELVRLGGQHPTPKSDSITVGRQHFSAIE